MASIQMIGILFAAFMLYFTFLHFKRNEFSRAESVVWLGLWLALIVLLLIPGFINDLIGRLGIARAFDLFTVLGFIFLIGLTFHLYTTVRKLEKRMKDVIQTEALKDLPKQ